MAEELAAQLSRRALVGGAIGGLVALVANAVGRPTPVFAAGDEGLNVKIGEEYYDARSKIYIANNTNAEYVFAAQSTHGGIALSGVSDSSEGVRGYSGSYVGVYGESPTGYGVAAATASGTAVFAAASGNGFGVIGTTDGTGAAVYGSATGTGAGVRALSLHGVALKVDGKTTFTRSGRLIMPIGSKSKTFSLIHDITVSSTFMLTLETNQNGLGLLSYSKNAAQQKVKVNLSAPVASGKYAYITYLILN